MKDFFKPGRQPHDLAGPDEFMKLGLDKGVGPVDFIKQSRLRLPDREGGGDELQLAFGQRLGIEEAHQVVKVKGWYFVVSETDLRP